MWENNSVKKQSVCKENIIAGPCNIQMEFLKGNKFYSQSNIVGNASEIDEQFLELNSTHNRSETISMNMAPRMRNVW